MWRDISCTCEERHHQHMWRQSYQHMRTEKSWARVKREREKHVFFLLTFSLLLCLFCQVDRVAIDHLDELEGVSKGHYVRRPLALTGLQSLQFFNYDPSGEIQAEAYFAAAPLTQGLAASSAHIEAYTKKQTVNYVPRKDRPQNRTFLEHVNAWIESQSQSVQLEVCSRWPTSSSFFTSKLFSFL